MRAEALTVVALVLLPIFIQAGGGASAATPGAAPPHFQLSATGGSAWGSSAPGDVPRYADLADIVFSINESAMHDTILWLQYFKTRYCLASNNRQVVDAISERMSSGGAWVRLEPFQQGVAMLYNVVATINGTGPSSDEIVIACAHLDSVTGLGNRTTWAPGADDNGSGTAAVILFADILAQYQWNRTIKLVAFNAEELGLTGSEDFAADSAARADDIVGAFNMDMIGYCGSDAYLDIVYPNTTYFPGLDSEWMADSIIENDARHNLSIEPMKYMRTPAQAANSDHYPFWQNGYDAVCVIEKLNPDYPYYHTAQDTVDKLNMTYATDAARAVLGAVCDAAGINGTGDVRAPGHSFESPADGGYTPAMTTVRVDVVDAGGLDVPSIELGIDGSPVAATLSPIPSGRRVSFGAVLVDETLHTARIRARDLAGNLLDWNWTFTADSTPPSALSSFSIDTYSTHIKLDWGASPSSDVQFYKIFKASTPGGFNWASPLVTKDGSTFTHNDISAASTLGASFYCARPYDFAGNVGPATAVLGKMTVQVYTGLTMIGNPLDLGGVSPAVAFDYLGASWTEAQAYDAETGEWLSYAKAAPEWLRTLDAVEPDAGLWLKVSSAGLSLCLHGSPVMNPAIQLRKGWNLVAYPGYTQVPASSALAGVAYDGLAKYDYFASPYRMADMAGTEYMQLGQAYWVHVPADCVWTYAN